MLAALDEIAVSLGLPGGWDAGGEQPGFTLFTGPAAGSEADPEHLAGTTHAHSFRATSGPVMRARRGKVPTRIARAATFPAVVSA
jgi:hypothetical protein